VATDDNPDSQVRSHMTRAHADMLLDAWRATLGRSAFVTSAVHDILGLPPRSFHQWAIDNAAAFAGEGLVSNPPAE
jgi:hypothetical protein